MGAYAMSVKEIRFHLPGKEEKISIASSTSQRFPHSKALRGSYLGMNMLQVYRAPNH
jgi:hypothetical protein